MMHDMLVTKNVPIPKIEIEEIRFAGFFDYPYPVFEKIIFNDKATIMIWKDGTKTIVKKSKEEAEDDREKAIAYCTLKKMLGNDYGKYLRKCTKEIEKFEDAKRGYE